jgi:multiple sugar transport system substrate-binding protein
MTTSRRRHLRQLVAAASAGVAAPAIAQSKPEKLVIMGHAVHRASATGAKGGDSAGAWASANGLALEWITLGVPEVHDRLYREATLAQGSVDLGLVANRYIGPRLATMFEPLDEFMRREPIEDFGDIAPGMVQAMTWGGKVYGVPYRHATSGLHFNTALIAAPPKTIEELIEQADKLTFKRADGQQIHGFILDGTSPAQIIDVTRAWNGDFLTEDYQLRVTEEPMLRTIALLRDWFAKGVLPRTFTKFTTEETIAYMTTGRGAMSITPFGRHEIFNDPAKSQVAGKMGVGPVPSAAALAATFPVAPAKTEFWSFVIPRNTKHKELAWSLVRALSSKAGTLRAAINGNGPVRSSTYAEPQLKAMIPYAAAEAAVLKVARPPLPGWDNAARAEDIFREEVDLVLVAGKTPKDAMDSVARRVQPLLPPK